MDCVLLCDFGSMQHIICEQLQNLAKQSASNYSGDNLNGGEQFFKDMMQRLNLTQMEVFADAPYIALNDNRKWHVRDHTRIQSMCTALDQRAQNLLLQHTKTKERVRLINCHTPTSICNTLKKKQDTIRAIISNVHKTVQCWQWR